MPIKHINLQNVLCALFFFVCFCDKSYSGEFVENPRCIEYLDGEVVGLYKGNEKIGFVQLGGKEGLLGAVFIDGIKGNETDLYIGMQLPHKQDLCFAYFGIHQVVKKKDGSQCWLRAYIITPKLLLNTYLDYLDNKLLPLRNIEVEKLYPHCGSDFTKLTDCDFTKLKTKSDNNKTESNGSSLYICTLIFFIIVLIVIRPRKDEYE